MKEQEDKFIKSLNLDDRLVALEQNGIPGVRDFFATSALSCLGNPAMREQYDTKSIAAYCYKMADAMILERDKCAK